MALEAADVLVVQKVTGAQENRKLSVQQLAEFIQSSNAVTFKGVADLTLASAEPASAQNGDLYVNSQTAPGEFAWTGGTNPYTGIIQPNAQTIYVTTAGWQVANNSTTNLGVEQVQSTLPITIDGTIAAKPIVGVLDATTATSGVVTIATDNDVAAGTEGVVVTALQLKDTNDNLSAFEGTVTSVSGVDPIEVTAGTNTSTPEISIKDSAVSQKGAVALISDSAVAASNATTATTPKYVADFYLNQNFNQLTDA